MAETITTDNKSTLLYRFLVSPELRWARYLVLIMVLATISFNQVFIIFLDYRDILGGWIYTFTFLYLSEVEQLKEQVSPELLFKTLHHSGELTLSEPEKASKMLMKLSQLLRYQLYDCSRTKVLLSSEINFLNNYLTLEQNSQAQFNYELLADGEVNRTLVPPLLFIPFVQYIVKSINEQRTSIPVSLKIHLKVEENTIIFTCLCLQVNLLEDKGLERIRQRLNLLYGNRYRLFLTTESIWLELKGGEV